MTHKYRFSIDPKTKVVTNLFSDTITLMQGNHNSERIAFVLPRYIEEHDMFQCNSVQIHYDNIGEDGEKTSGVYIVNDMCINEGYENAVLFSWLISRNATSRAGTLQFTIRFASVTDGTIEYNWNTDMYKDVVIKPTLDNSGSMEEQYSDSFEALLSKTKSYIDEAVTEGEWHDSLKGEKGDKGDDYILTDNDKQAIVESVETSLRPLVYDTLATDTQDDIVAYTDIGADDIPPKKMIIRRTSSTKQLHSSITLRRLGKNLFDPSEDAFKVGYYIDKDTGEPLINDNYACSKAFIPVLPNTDYVFSGKITGKKTANTVAFYDANGVFISRYTPKNPDGSTAFNVPSQFTTPPDCHFIRYNVSYNVYEFETPQLEIGKTATSYEEYAPTDYEVTLKTVSGSLFSANYKSLDLLRGIGITFSGTEIRFMPPPVTTKHGINHFFVVNGTAENEQMGVASLVYTTLRLDPTLAYNKLKAAIVAAGTT